MANRVLIQIALEMWGAVFCAVFLVFIWLNPGTKSRNDRLLTGLIFHIALLLVSDCLAWFTRGGEGVLSTIVVRVSNYLVFVLNYALGLIVLQHPDLTECQRLELMYELNSDRLDDERVNLNIPLSRPILVIGDLGRWNGRVMGYKEIPSGNIRDCLYSNTDYSTWYMDKLGDLRCDAVHHDGTNHYLYRTYKDGVTEEQIDRLKGKIYNAFPTAITQNVEYLLDSVQASTMLSNSEFIVMLNQAASDREKLGRLLNISNEQMNYITNVEAGSGLIKYGSALVPFINRFPKNTKLYQLMTTRPGEGRFAGQS